MSGLSVLKEEGVARIVFDRPGVLNALSPSLLSDLIETCADLGRDDSVRLVVFEGAGDCFSRRRRPACFPFFADGPPMHETPRT